LARAFHSRRRLWGKNPTGAVGFLLKFLLQALAHPFLAFGQHLVFEVPQRAGDRFIGFHGPPTAECFFPMGGEPFTPQL
jgi:hypothetical protein